MQQSEIRQLHGQSTNPHGAGRRQGGSRQAIRAVGHVTGQGNATAGQRQHAGPPGSGYLFFRMRPVEAQEEVGVPAVQEEVCCSEGNREALNIVAEVGGDPEVRDKGVHKDILGRERPTRRKVRLREVRAEPRLAVTKAGILGGQALEERNLPAPTSPSPITV